MGIARLGYLSGRAHAASSVLAWTRTRLGHRSYREIPVSSSTAPANRAGICSRDRQFRTTLGLETPNALAALVGPPRASIAASTGGTCLTMRLTYHAT